MNRPRVGEIVHYKSYGTPKGEYEPACRAAVITETFPSAGEALIGLCVLNPSGMFFNTASQDEEQSFGGTWHWPCVQG